MWRKATLACPAMSAPRPTRPVGDAMLFDLFSGRATNVLWHFRLASLVFNDFWFNVRRGFLALLANFLTTCARTQELRRSTSLTVSVNNYRWTYTLGTGLYLSCCRVKLGLRIHISISYVPPVHVIGTFSFVDRRMCGSSLSNTTLWP